MGAVQSGRRPAVVLHSSDSLRRVPVVIIVPGTSKQAALRFPHTTLVEPSTANGLRMPTVFLGFQIMAVNPTWLGQPSMGALSTEEMERIEDIVVDAIGMAAPEQ